MASSPLPRIGELSKCTGVSAELLRAWERRYGLLRPARSSGGLRLYASPDAKRVRLMQQHLAEGLAAAEAAASGGAAAGGVVGSDGELLLTGDPIAEAARVTALACDKATAGEVTA